MPTYTYECRVKGAWDGEVYAKNKQEAIKRAKEELSAENLVPDGEIEVYLMQDEE